MFSFSRWSLLLLIRRNLQQRQRVFMYGLWVSEQNGRWTSNIWKRRLVFDKKETRRPRQVVTGLSRAMRATPFPRPAGVIKFRVLVYTRCMRMTSDHCSCP